MLSKRIEMNGMSYSEALRSAKAIASVRNRAVYIKSNSIDSGFRVDTEPGTFGCVRVTAAAV